MLLHLNEIKAQHLKLFALIERLLMSRAARYLDLFFILIALAAIICSSYEQMHRYRYFFFAVAYLSSLAFTVEYVLRIFSAPVCRPDLSWMRARWKYIFSFYGLVDFVGMLPFLLIYIYRDAPVAHITMLPYIFVIFKLIRYSKSLRMILQVLSNVKGELLTAYTASGIMVCFSAILMYYIERNAQPEAFSNVGDGIWWAVVAFTTVGYGDIYPITPLGKVLSSVISLIGIAMIAIPTGIISSSFINIMQKKEQEREREEVRERRQQ